jgi:hypothetical protein
MNFLDHSGGLSRGTRPRARALEAASPDVAEGA